ncbi:Hypothetical protein SRAE_1000322500 [Strongyloides ratti]|uniref:Uncharacterized protein n=1 Tax=Strongyloides ratti TaxID=34506 RepID=A0A090L5G3_STRRB|nr:Hypothetical protein SRAE_1000322500 [Strongyloides ratti]CEF64972.1 Hypothetical protein SRAE_1000322500 [Strongyloides ratti]
MLSSKKSLTNYNNAKLSLYQDKDLYLDLLKLRLTESNGTFNKKEKMTPYEINSFCYAPVRPNLRRSRINHHSGLLKSRCLFQSSKIITATPGDDGNTEKK